MSDSQFTAAVRLTVDDAQYTQTFTKAGVLAEAFSAQLQGAGLQAGAGLQEAVIQADKLGATASSSSQVAASGMEAVTKAAATVGTTMQASTAQGREGLQATAAAAQATGTALQESGVQGKAALDAIAKASQSARAAQEQARQAGAAFLADLRDQIAVSGKSAEQLLRYRAAQAGVAAEASGLILQLQNQRAAHLAAAESARQEESAQREAAAAKLRATAAQDSFMASLREQVALQGKSSTEVLQYRAAQLGVSESAAHYIRAIEGVNTVNKVGTISAGQHAAAMRMLPAQMTDVFTSIAGGMPIWMVAIQQGGQIKDSFGGAGAAARALLGAITPLAVGLTAVTVGAGVLAAAYYQGSAEADRYRQAIVMSGNAAGVTVGQMAGMARAISETTGTQNAASRVLAEMARTGQVGAEDLQHFTEVAMGLEKYAGQSIQTTVQHLAELGKAPVQASIKLNEQYNYLTPAVYRQIEALERQGRTEEAAAVAQRAYTQEFERRKNELAANLGYLERLWYGLGSAAKWTWDQILNIGRPTTDEQSLAVLKQNLANLEERNARPGFKEGKVTKDLREEIRLLEEKIAAQRQSAQAQADGAKNTSATVEWSRMVGQYASNAVKKEQELTLALQRRNDALKAAGSDAKERNKVEAEYGAMVKSINERFKERKSSTTGQVSVTDTQLAGLRSQLEAAQQYHQQLQTLGATASQLNAGERESLKITEQLKVAVNAKTIARLKEAQTTANALGVQLRTNEGLENEFKAQQKLSTSMASGTANILQRAKEQEVANAVIGKSRSAIEEMTLAELEHQMAEAQSSDRFTPQYIADLEAKIDAQNRLVKALRAGEKVEADLKVSEKSKEDAKKSVDGINEVFRSGFANMLSKDSNFVSSFGKSLRNTVATAVADAFYSATLKNAVESFTLWLRAQMTASMAASTGGGGGFMSLIGAGLSLLGGGTAASAQVANALPGNSLDNFLSLNNNFTVNAKGGAYPSTGLSSFSNSVVTKPTMFAFAKGVGLMGEAPGSPGEAIVPLQRMADGRLGVAQAHGGNSGGGTGSFVYAPTFNVDSRSDRAATIQDMRRVSADQARAQNEQLKRMKVIPQ